MVAMTAGITAQAAFAGDAGTARFNYAPNIWKVEGVRVPSLPEAPHSVKSGSVPQGPNFLGLSPQLLAKPAPAPVQAQVQAQAPRVQTQVSSRPTVAQAVPQMAAPKFNSSFGKAGSLPAPPVVANAPAITPSVPQAAAQANSLPPQAKAAPAKGISPARPLVAHHRAWQSVSGKLNRPKAPEGLVADAGRKIDSYGGGYVPGPFLPAAYNGEGSSARTDVSGKLLNQHQHRK